MQEKIQVVFEFDVTYDHEQMRNDAVEQLRKTMDTRFFHSCRYIDGNSHSCEAKRIGDGKIVFEINQ